MKESWFAVEHLVVASLLAALSISCSVGSIDPTSPSTGPTTSAKFNGTYDFFFKNPGPNGTESRTLQGFLVITNGVVSSTDATVTGSVDNFGKVTFTAPCPINNSVGDWTGSMNASALAGANFGQGQYTCRLAIGGGNLNTWQATQSQ